MREFLIFFSLISSFTLQAQEYTLAYLYEQAQIHFPLYQQFEMNKKTTELQIQNSRKAWLPQAQISGGATYQSDVTEIPVTLPNFHIDPMSKDQYKVQAEVYQLIFDGGKVKLHQEQILMSQLIEDKKNELNLYKLRERVAQLFFGILLYDKQIQQRNLLEENMNAALSKAELALKEGVTYKSVVNELKAELLSAQMTTEEIHHDKTAALQMLSELTGVSLTADTKLLWVEDNVLNPNYDNQRPELQLFELQRKNLELRKKQIWQHRFPQINGFLNAGYGRPGLNMLKNSFEPFAIGGIQFQWKISGFYTEKKELEIIDFQMDKFNTEKEAFLLNTQIESQKELSQMAKYEQLILKDEAIIELRREVVKSAEAQLQNGVINSHEFINKLNALHSAEITKNLHEILYIKSKENLKNITGL
ncbi:MAG: TolC family protein [Flavobacteriaceae bacterium]|nr:TolC family protein [Flavobacteriaceae bacterium]